MSELITLALQGASWTGEAITSVLEPVTSLLGGSETATGVTSSVASGLEQIPVLNTVDTSALQSAITGTSKAAGQIAGVAAPVVKAAPVVSALASLKKPDKVKMPSGPSSPAITRSPPKTTTAKRGQGVGRRAPAGKRKSGYSTIGRGK